MIQFEHVTKVLGGKSVLDGVDYSIERGEIFVIVGLSGAGKSVSLKHMVRLLTPDEGKVIIDGQEISKARGRQLESIRSKFGVLFQSAALLQWLTVGENVALPLVEHSKLTPGEIDKRVRENLELVSLEAAYHKLPSELSGGMRKRVGLARAIVTRPEIVLYDEPTSGLDPVTSRKIDHLIKDLSEELGITSVVVTHDLHSALSIASRIAMLHEGKLVEVADPQGFIHSDNDTVQKFLSSQYITRRGSWERNQDNEG